MEIPEQVIPAIRNLVHELVAGNYQGLAADGRAGRLTARELQEAVSNYGRTLVELPAESFDPETARAYALSGDESRQEMDVDVDLWTVEEGRSDLTLQAHVQVTSDNVTVKIEDLHVL